MRYLWLTWIDPVPEHDGQRIYSGRLIDAIASAGAEIDVLCYASAESRRFPAAPGDRVRWWPVLQQMNSPLSSVFSSLPNVTHRSHTGSMKRALRSLATFLQWDRVVIDGIYMGWALQYIDELKTPGGARPEIIYISHNHEQSLRQSVANTYRGNPAKAALMRFDARKAARMECTLLDKVDFLTAITDEDAALYRKAHPERRMIVLPPGYSGERIEQRRITADTPRRAVILGSFEWIAKRMNLEAFVKVADPLFAAAGAELMVVGNGDAGFIKELQQQCRATTFAGEVEEVASYLGQSRIAIVPEYLGGGFKLKVLDYVFHRLPIAAIAGSVAGAPLTSPVSILTFETLEDLAKGVVDAIDDLPLLNRLQEQAHTACAERFDWDQRGKAFLAETDLP